MKPYENSIPNYQINETKQKPAKLNPFKFYKSVHFPLDLEIAYVV